MHCRFGLQAAAVGLLIFFCVMRPVGANALELTGAWASQADLCKMVFMKKGNQVAFAPLSDLYGTGLIIDGEKIRGKNAQCRIKSRKQATDTLEFSAACATGIMTSNVRFNIKMMDDNNFLRILPEIEGMTVKYTRCSL